MTGWNEQMDGRKSMIVERKQASEKQGRELASKGESNGENKEVRKNSIL